jgi:hypothetical protein
MLMVIYILTYNAVLFFQDPQTLFANRRYQSSGALYFRDRTLYTESESRILIDYFSKMVKHPSQYAKTQRLLLNLTSFEQESGVIVMDKKRGGMFVLLLASMLNMDPFKDSLYESSLGDKESFWMSSEALGDSYRWSNGAGGAIGIIHPVFPTAVCGHLLHTDEHWNPLWFNGGMILNKLSDGGVKTVYEMTSYAIDRTMRKVKW